MKGRLILLLALVYLPLLLLLLGVYHQYHQTRLDEALQTEMEVARGVANTFDTWLDGVRWQLDALGRALAVIPSEDEEAQLQILRGAAMQQPPIQHIDWIDIQGRVVASNLTARKGDDISEAPFYRAIMSGAAAWKLDDLSPDGDHTDCRFSLGLGVRGENDTIAGVVAATFDPGALGALTLVQQRPRDSVYQIFDGNGTMVFHSERHRLGWAERSYSPDPFLHDALEQERPAGGTAHVPRRGDMLLARVPIESVSWVAGASTPKAVALAEVRRTMTRDIVHVVLIIILSSGLAILVALTISPPLKVLEKDARSFQRGFPTRETPWAPKEVKKLRRSIGDMVRKLEERATAVEESERRLRHILEVSPFPTMVHRDDGAILLMNPSLLHLTGLDPSEIDSVSDWEERVMLSPPERCRISHDDPRGVTDSATHHGEVKVRTDWGDELTWDYYSAALGVDREGRRLLVTTAADLTEQRRREEEVRTLAAALQGSEAALLDLTEQLEQRVAERTEDLQQANREMESFSYTVSHDLRAPLRHIQSFVDLLRAQAGELLDSKSTRYLSTIAESAQRMGRLIDDLMVFSRIVRVPMVEGRVHLDRLVQEARAELAPEMEDRDIRWSVEPLPTVIADPTLLRTVLVNLLSNAIKYTRLREQATIRIASEEVGDELVISVEDNGAGFDPRFKDRLFQVFQRLHKAEEFEGSGIGLASVQRIIQRHCGRTWAEGEPDRGATFYFSLPLKRKVG